MAKRSFQCLKPRLHIRIQGAVAHHMHYKTVDDMVPGLGVMRHEARVLEEMQVGVLRSVELQGVVLQDVVALQGIAVQDVALQVGTTQRDASQMGKPLVDELC